jgi:hypothetical protein
MEKQRGVVLQMEGRIEIERTGGAERDEGRRIRGRVDEMVDLGQSSCQAGHNQTLVLVFVCVSESRRGLLWCLLCDGGCAGWLMAPCSDSGL